MPSDLLPWTNRLIRSAALVIFFVVPATRAQTPIKAATQAPAGVRSTLLAQTAQPHHAPATAAASSRTSIKYFCFSTDPKQQAVYFSDLFDRPDSGSEADNFMEYQLAKDDFQIYLVDKYKYSEAEDLVDCSYMSTATTVNTATALAKKKRSKVAQAVAAKKRVVETGWKYKEPQPDDDPIGSGGFITPPTR